VSGSPRGLLPGGPDPRVAHSRLVGWGRPARFGPCLARRVGSSRAGRPQAVAGVGWPGSVRVWALALDALGLCTPRPGSPRPGMLRRSVCRATWARSRARVMHGGDPTWPGGITGSVFSRMC
jgi:hypothetical protein